MVGNKYKDRRYNYFYEVVEVYPEFIWANKTDETGKKLDVDMFTESFFNEECVRIDSFPWEKEKDNRDLCSCPIRVLMTSGCQCGGR